MPEEIRSERVMIRFTRAELAAIDSAAAAENTPTASWCHDFLVCRATDNTAKPSEIDSQILARLSEIEGLLRLCAGAVNPYNDLDLARTIRS